MKITAFLPCRKGSQRVENKNTRKIANYENGLLQIKLEHLLKTKSIDTVIVSSNDEEVLKYASNLNNAKLILHKRDERLCANTTATDELVAYVYDLVKEGETLWTHTTSPFFSAKDYEMVIKTYAKVLEQGFDSLMSVTALQGFFWDEKGAINYDTRFKKWPATQNTKAIYELNSAVFLANAKIYKNFNNRIGQKPFLYKVDKIKGLDIDDKEDFIMAEVLLEFKNGGGHLRICLTKPLKRSA